MGSCWKVDNITINSIAHVIVAMTSEVQRSVYMFATELWSVVDRSRSETTEDGTTDNNISPSQSFRTCCWRERSRSTSKLPTKRRWHRGGFCIADSNHTSKAGLFQGFLLSLFRFHNNSLIVCACVCVCVCVCVCACVCVCVCVFVCVWC